MIVRNCNLVEKLECYSIDRELVDLISQKKQLQELKLTFHMMTVQKNLLTPIINLKNLRKLSITSQCQVHNQRLVRPSIPVTDDLLIEIGANLHNLEALSLGGEYLIIYIFSVKIP